MPQFSLLIVILFIVILLIAVSLFALKIVREIGINRYMDQLSREGNQPSSHQSTQVGTGSPAHTRSPSLAKPILDSPAEEEFWLAWQEQYRRHRIELATQYPVGRYRLDFAHSPTRTAIEIDGMAGHSSPDEITKDRKRQRFIEQQGWHFIRFGAKEVFKDSKRCALETEQFILRAQRSPSR